MKDGLRAGKRVAIHAAICAACTGFVILITFYFLLPVIFRSDYWLQDRVMELGRKTPVNEDILFLGIDQATQSIHEEDPEDLAKSRALQLMAAQQFPWSREVHALAIEKLCNAGARLVIIDLMFDTEGPGDAEFKAALDRWRDRVVIGSNLVPWMPDTDVRAEPQWVFVPPSDSIIEHTFPVDDRIGFVVLPHDLDDTVRSIWLETTLDIVRGDPAHANSEWYQSITAAALRKLGRGDLVERREDARSFRFTKMEHDTYKPRSYYGIFWPELWEQNYGGGELVRGKIVVIGPSAPIFHDVVSTPFGTILGSQLHISAIAAALAGEFYEQSGVVRNLVAVLGMGLVAFLVTVAIKRPLVRVFLLAGGFLLFVVLAVINFNVFNYSMTLMSPLLAYGLSGGFCFGYDFARNVMEELRLRRTLSRYVSKDLAQEILNNREDYFSALGGTDKEVTILFSDIRGFTAMTEELGGKILPQLNEYLGEMVDAVFLHHGTVDKFIGDAVMAVWGSVESGGPKTDATRAVTAAVAMRERLAVLNERWNAEGKRPFHIGLGLNHGTALFGNIGSVERMDPTVIGDEVNLASRLEGLTKEYRCQIIISGSVADLVRDEFALRSVDRVQVLGKRRAVDIFSVLGPVGEAGQAPPWLAAYEEGVQAFRGRNFETAREIFRGILNEEPGDYLCAVYLERSEKFLREAPGEEWQGVAAMESK